MEKEMIERNLSGWLNIYKPKGLSSANVVSKVKRAFRMKVGHAGTLDPLAEGVLPIAIGEATKLTSYLVDARKTYEFKIKFGCLTDTSDAEGKIIDETTHIPSDILECRSIIPLFLGTISQIPSRYSAIKIDGKRAYDLARQDIDFEMKSRQIEIFSLECLDYSEGVATYIAECSKGTYIRTLAEDIAKSLQSLGFVIELRRLKVGIFDYANSLHKFEDPKTLKTNLMRPEVVLDDILELKINQEIANSVKSGKLVQVDHADTDKVYLTLNGKLIAIGLILSGCFKSFRVFNL